MPESKTQSVIDSCEQALRSKTLAENILLRQELFEKGEERTLKEASVREVIEYARPDLSRYLDETQRKGEKRTSKLYTSKVTTDIEMAADAFVGNVFNPGGWFGYRMDQLELNNVDLVQVWLQQLKEHFDAVYIKSGFYEVLPPLVMDAFSIGDGIVYEGQDKDTQEAMFEYCELLATWFTRNRTGNFIAVHRKMCFPALTAWERWGVELSDDCISAAYKDPSREFCFIHAVYDRNDPMLIGMKLPKQRDFVEFWVQVDSDRNARKDTGEMTGILEQSGYHTMPFMDWPYWLKSTESIGRGPIESALVTVKRLHADHKTLMVKGQRDAAPPLKASMSLKSRTNLGPDAITWIKSGGSEDLQEIYRGSGYSSGLDLVERTEEQIEEALHLSTFLMHSMATKRMTIPEFMERAGEKAAALAPRMGLMEKYLLENIHNRTWDIEDRAGRIPPAPPQLIDAVSSGQVSGKLNVRYNGPLRQAQEQLTTQRRIAGNISMVDQLAKYNPQAAADKINVSKGIEHVLDQGDFWQDSIVSEAEIEEKNRIRQELAMAQAQSEQENMDSQTAQNMSGALKNVEAGSE